MNDTGDERSLLNAMLRGFTGKCPNCGEGKLFARTLTVVDECPSCHEIYSHHRADDLPAYLNVFIVGHVVIGFMMIVMSYDLLGMWATTFVTAGLCIVVGLMLMRPLKGMVVGSQWALKMHGFDGGDNSLG